MRLLDRYLLRELLLPLTYCVAGFLLCFITFDIVNEIGAFQRNNLTGIDILEYYANKAPELLVSSYVMPMSLLLALLYALTAHLRHHELTAIRTAGVSLWRMCVPYFAVGFAFSLVVFVLNETVVPGAAEDAERILLRHAAGQPKAADKIWKKNVIFLNAADNRTWQIGAYHLQARIMINPQIDWRRHDGSRVQLFAERARWIDRRWVFTNVQQFVYASRSDDIPLKITTNLVVLPELTETPRLIRSEIRISALDNLRAMRKTQLSSRAIHEYLQLHPTLDRLRADMLRTLLQSRLAAPWTCLVVVLIAIPFGVLPGRRNVFVGVASSIFICFVFLIVRDLTLALGSGGRVAPWVAAWAPNILFGATGFALMWRVR